MVKVFRNLPAGCGGAVVMSVSCHVRDPGSIALEVACHSVISTLFYLVKTTLFYLIKVSLPVIEFI